MKIQLRRHISAWILLSVFLPAVVMMSLHRHGESGDYGCVECVKHLPHADHIGQQTVHFSECLVCDFSAQPYLSGVVSSFSHFSEYLALATFFRQPELLHRSAGPVALRAPPFRTARG